MYAPCVYLSSISCVNRLPPVSSLDSLRARTDRSLLRACRRRPGGETDASDYVYEIALGLCTKMRGTPGVSLNRLG